MAKNNFAKSGSLRNGATVPPWQVLFKDDLHGFEVVAAHFFPVSQNPAKISTATFRPLDVFAFQGDVRAVSHRVEFTA